MLHRVVVTRALPGEWLEPLGAAGLTVVLREGQRPARRDELLSLVAGADALITFIGDRVDDELLEAAGGQLRLVANFAVGYDNIDVAACAARGVLVSNTPDVLTDATADHAFALLLAVARRLREGHELVASGGWTGWEPTQLLGVELAGSTMGIVGMGRIGQAVARRAAAFGMSVIYAGRNRRLEAEAESGARHLPFPELLEESDFVSLHCPLTPATAHLIDDGALASMRPTAVLINTARGGIVDDAALARALREGRIFGAGLDVFEGEPRVHPELLTLRSVVLAPHTGSATSAARAAMARLCVDAVLAVARGGAPRHLVSG